MEIAGSAAAQLSGSTDQAWRNHAACLEEDPELFFPEGESERYQRQIDAALEVCGSCPVVDECLSYALEADQRTGIWGGTTAEQRRRLRVGASRSSSTRRGRTAVVAAAGAVVAAGAVAAPSRDHEITADLRRAVG